ncbi:DUF2235 domain-containing protein [Lysobacter sp. A3-1-A15]|uniref:DUF2235 domain-containing protein n=1 Tax=Novilysobacter viscosus TaxID=3098602 RepID=UPI002EDAC89D
MGGKKPDGVGSYRASEHDFAVYEAVEVRLTSLPVPTLLPSNSTDHYLYVAAFDGTGQDLHRKGASPTNVGSLHQQVDELASTAGSRVAGGYQAGPGTQRNPLVRIPDQLLGSSVDDRAMAMYRQFAEQVFRWKVDNPAAEVHIAALGYSRGAISVPAFTRMVDRFGIAHPDGMEFGRDAHGEITVVSRHAPLVPPGRTAQAVLLYDPVATGVPRDFDLRLPPSVISGLTLMARDERRALFPHTTLIGQGMSEDGRFLGVTVPGAHSDVGGGNTRNGLEIRAGNLGIDYLNALTDSRPFNKRALPEDPSLTVVHRSHQAMLGAFAIGASDPGDPRYLRERLCVVVDPCRDAEPRNDALASRFTTQMPTIGPVPTVATAAPLPDQITMASSHAPSLHDVAHPGHGIFMQARDGLHALDGWQPRATPGDGDRLAAALAAQAQRSGLAAIDHVLLARDGDRVFAVQGALHDPAHRRTSVEAASALAQPLSESADALSREPALREPQHARDLPAPPMVEPASRATPVL